MAAGIKVWGKKNVAAYSVENPVKIVTSRLIEVLKRRRWIR